MSRIMECLVCGRPIDPEKTMCQTCLDFRALLRVYIEQVPHVSALSLKRLLNEARKP